MAFQIIGAVLGAQLSIGWALGMSLGGMLGGILNPPKGQDIVADSLTRLTITGTGYGDVIPYVAGSPRLAGQIVELINAQKIAHVTEVEGGKGGPSSSTYTTYTYKCDVLYMLANIEQADAILQVYRDGELILNQETGADAESIFSTWNSEHWDSIEFLDGNQDQLPIPDLEAHYGVGEVPAYRGRVCVWIKGLNLFESGQIPNLEFVLAQYAEQQRPNSIYESLAYVPQESRYYNEMRAEVIGSLIYHVREGAGSPNYNGFFVDIIHKEDGLLRTIQVGGDGDNYTPWGVYKFAGKYVMRTEWSVYVVFYPGEWDKIGIARFDRSGNLWETKIVQSSSWVGGLSASWNIFRGFKGSQEYIYTCGSLNLAQGFYMERFDVKHGISAQRYTPGYFMGEQYCIAQDRSHHYVVIYSRFYSRFVVFSTFLNEFFFYRDDLPSPCSQLIFDATRGVFVGACGRYLVEIDAINETWTSYLIDTAPVGSDITDLSFCYAKGIVDNRYQYIVTLDTSTTNPAIAVYDKEELTAPTDVFLYATGNDISATALQYNYRDDYIVAADYTPLSGGGNVRKFWFKNSTYTPGARTIKSVVEEICDLSGLSASQIDTTDLSSITKPVILARASVEPAREMLQILGAAYYFDCVLSNGKLKFVERGGAAARAFTFDDLGAGIDGPERNPLTLHRLNDVEVPARFSVSYHNRHDAQLIGTEISSRVPTQDGTTNAITLPIALTPAQAKGIADTMRNDAEASKLSTDISVFGSNIDIEPTDIVLVTSRAGNQYRFRVAQSELQYPIVKLKLVQDDIGATVDEGITSDNYNPNTQVGVTAETDAIYLDLPPLTTSQVMSVGHYVAAGPDLDTGSKWGGAAIFGSYNDTDYEIRAIAEYQSTIGYCTTILGDWTGGYVFDEGNFVLVNVGSRVLSSTTQDKIIESHRVNAAVIGSEIVQYRDAVLISADPNIYKLSGFLRGKAGTEWASTGHINNERFIALTASTIDFVQQQVSDIDRFVYYRAVTSGFNMADVPTDGFTNTGILNKPFSPVYLSGSRNPSGDLSIFYQRRTRDPSATVVGQYGSFAPLAEEIEAFEIDIYDDDTYTTVVRTITSNTNNASYTAAEQAADFGSVQAAVYVKVYQMSALVGRGYPLTGVI